MADALATHGWSVEAGFVKPRLTAMLAEQARAEREAGTFRRARVGIGATLALRPEIRTDWVRWIDPAEASLAEHRFLRVAERLRVAINRRLFLGLFELESHLTAYPPGARYARHVDQFDGTRHRVVSCLLYLNEGWRDEDGGELRLELPGGGALDVLPRAGTLVTFLSADLPHEVRPALRERLSITGWFRTRA